MTTFGAVPVSAFNMHRLLQNGEAVLLFPGAHLSCRQAAGAFVIQRPTAAGPTSSAQPCPVLHYTPAQPSCLLPGRPLKDCIAPVPLNRLPRPNLAPPLLRRRCARGVQAAGRGVPAVLAREVG